MTAQHDLADLLRAHEKEVGAPSPLSYAAAIIAAGWRPPARVVSTVEELDALPEGSVVRELDTGPFLGIPTIPGVFEKFPNDLGWFCVAGHGDRMAEIAFPATVLHEPEATP